MKQKTICLAMCLTLLFGFNSCWEDFTIDGNGIVVTETRTTRQFDEVQSSGSFIIEIIPGDEFNIEIEAESNLLENIITEVDNDKLKIRTRSGHNLHNHHPMEVTIVMPSLTEVNQSGSGYIHTGNFESDHFTTKLSGSGEIETNIITQNLKAYLSGSGKIILNGEAVKSDFTISGSGKIHSYELEHQFCEVHISGSGDAYVNVEKTLDVNISGSGDVFYINTPAIHKKVSGSGNVINEN